MLERTRSPFERAQEDPGFLAAVARELPAGTDPLDALRRLDDPAAPGRDGRPGPAVAVEEARAALYRPGADEALRERHRRLAAALADEQARTRAAVHRVADAEQAAGLQRARSAEEAAEQGTDAERDAAPPGEPRDRAGVVRRRRLGIGVAAAALVLMAGGLAWAQHRSGPVAPRTSAASTPIARLLAAEPQLLPAAWRDADLITSSDVLDGAAPLSAPDGHGRTRLLLVVRCPAADRSFQAVVQSATSATPQYNACGRLTTIVLPEGLAGPVRVVVTTRGVLPFSGALLQR